MDTGVFLFVDNFVSYSVGHIVSLVTTIIAIVSTFFTIIAISQSKESSRKLEEHNEKLRLQHEKEYNEATENLSLEIEGKWFSAEINFKENPITNAIYELEIKRGKIGNEVELISGSQLYSTKNKTEWSANGRVTTTNTVVFNWKGVSGHTTRYGCALMQFIENGRGIGYWFGYSSRIAGHPVYGYWILSKDEDDLKELAEIALSKFAFLDVKELIENKDKIIHDREILLEAEKLIKDPHDYFRSDVSIENYKKTFHIYHLTTETTGKNAWKYHTINFAENSNDETLVSDFLTINAEGISVPSRINARKIGEHLVMIVKQTEGNEPLAICVFPFAYRIEDINYGFIFGMSWLKKPYQGKMIISKSQIISTSASVELQPGILLDSQSEFLEDLWKKGFDLKLLKFKIK